MKVRAKLKAPRHKFGHQCRFGDSTACVLAEITSDPDLEAFVVKKDVCTVEYDTTPQYSTSVADTKIKIVKRRG